MSTARSFERHAGPRDLLYLAHPELWPLWPLLPLLRLPVGAPPEFGVLLDRAGCGPTVFLIDHYRGLDVVDDAQSWPRLAYASLDDLAGDGWLVD
jgi:hypothetical protein